MFRDTKKLLSVVPEAVADVLSLAEEELRGVSLAASKRRVELLKIREQLEGGAAATAEKYHPDQYGLNADQQGHFRRILERSHVNLVEPALDRLVNSIHAGKIQRRVSPKFPDLQKLVKSPAHVSALARLCENAFAYGTACLVPISEEDGGIRYWLPDPVYTVVIVDPADVMDVLAIVEITGSSIQKTSVIRYVTKTNIGTVHVGKGDPVAEDEVHGLKFLPAVVAYGRDRRHCGAKYGKSLLAGVADATIRVTNNEVNLELLRDRQTQALLVVQGEASRTSVDDQEAQGKYIAFPNDGGNAHYETPESRIEAVIELTKRFCADAAVSSGLPLDTFLPELIAGSDASATAARIRAFPLQQRMTRLIQDWEMVEADAAVVVAGVAMHAGSVYAGELLNELRELIQPAISILPSLPEADSETLSNWQQKTANFFVRVEDAIEFYSENLSADEKAKLARLWMRKFLADRKVAGVDVPDEDEEEIPAEMAG